MPVSSSLSTTNQPTNQLILYKPTNTHLLLIFRKATPTGDSFILLNEQGLPISNTSPLLAAEGKMMVVAPLLLVAVTEAIRANGEVFEGLYVSHSVPVFDCVVSSLF